jgi:hypothetical protein
MIISATATASLAATRLWEYPVARVIPVMMGALVSNPGDMHKAAEQWQAPADGGMDLDAIKQEILGLKQAMANSKNAWKGPAWEAFSESVDTFADQVSVAKKYHEGVGGGMSGIATLYHWAVVVAFYVAVVMTLAATLNLLKSVYPPAWAAIMAAISGLLNPLAQMLRNLLSKTAKAVMGLTVTLVAVNAMCATLTQLIDKSRPKADFSPADLEYKAPKDGTTVGTLQPKNGGFPGLNLGSI